METNEQTTTQEATTGSENSLGHKESRGLSILSRPESSTSSDATSEHSEQYESEQTGQPSQDDTKETTNQSQVDELAQQKEIQTRAAQQGIDPAELAKAIVQAQQEAQRVQQAQPPTQEYSEEDFKRDFGIFEMDKDTFDSMFGADASPEQVEAFNHVIKRTSAMAVKMAQYQAQQMLEQFKREIQPIQAAYRGFQAKNVDKKFMSKYPQLAKHTNLVKSVVAQLKAEGRNFNTVDEAMDEAASRAKAMLQEAGVNLSQPQPKQRNQAQPATASVGPGGAGTRQSTSSAQSKSHGLNILKKAMN